MAKLTGRCCEIAEIFFRCSLKDEYNFQENIKIAVAPLDPYVDNPSRCGQGRVLQREYEQGEGEEHEHAEEGSIMQSAPAEDDGGHGGTQTDHAEEGESHD